jgi:tetratricopeptide (TPR) repeat protein
MGISTNRVELRFYKVGDRRLLNYFKDDWAGAAGLYQEREERAVVQIEESQFSDPLALVVTFAHELAHVRLLGDRRLQRDEADGELVTDLLTVFLGFGVFLANAASRSTMYLGLGTSRGTVKRGYLNDAEFAYALAILAWLQDQGEPPWASLLRPNVREPMLEAIRWLAQTDEKTHRPRGRRFDNLGQDIRLFPHPALARTAAEQNVQAEEPGELDHVGQGVFNLLAGRFADAVRELNTAIEENPDDVEAYQQRALAHIGLNRPEEALADAERAVALAPDDIESYCVRGKALMLNHRYDLAVADFDAVIEDNDNSGNGDARLAEAFYQRGLVRSIKGDAAAAVSDFSRAVVKAPYRPDLYEARAVAYEALGNDDKAQWDREEAEYRTAKPPS